MQYTTDLLPILSDKLKKVEESAAQSLFLSKSSSKEMNAAFNEEFPKRFEGIDKLIE